MSSQDKHITHWSASDVQKYLKGELSSREMHQLEKAALEDPFLADAIEGLSHRPPAPLANDLDELQTRLANRTGEKKSRPVAWMKMAAVIVLLLGLGFTAWYLLLNNHKDQVAAFANAPIPPASRAVAPSANAPTAKASQATEPAQRHAGVADTTSALSSAFLAHAPAPAHRPKIPVSATEFTKKDKADNSVPDNISMQNSRVASLDFMPAPAPANRLAADSMKAVLANGGNSYRFDSQAYFKNYGGGWQSRSMVYNGQVLDFNNRPLAGASLLVSGRSNAITTTDQLGQFKLDLKPQDTSQQLTVALVGYMNASVAVNKLNGDVAVGNTIFLKENPNALSEVVVTGQGRMRKESFATAPLDDKNEKLDSFWVKVAPVTGRLAYLNYLEAAKKTFPVDSTVRGSESISFGIDPAGTPIDFKIEHSLSPAHDAALLRLIMDGARWKVLHGKNVRAMVHLSFP